MWSELSEVVEMHDAAAQVAEPRPRSSTRLPSAVGVAARRVRKGRLVGGALDGRELQVTVGGSAGVIVEHYPVTGHRSDIVIAILADESRLSTWLETQGSAAVWRS